MFRLRWTAGLICLLLVLGQRAVAQQGITEGSVASESTEHTPSRRLTANLNGNSIDNAAQGEEEKSSLEAQIQELRQLVLQQAQEIKQQQLSLREQQQKLDQLEAKDSANKADNVITVKPAVYGGITSLASRSLAATPLEQAPSSAPSANAPKIKVGTTIYPYYAFQSHPTVTDSDGNAIHKNVFDLSRVYINFTGNISHLIAFRITPDISRESGGGSSLAGSNVFRLKYAFLQANLDEWTTKGTWVRFGLQQTPWVDFEEGIYRYRFQGPVFADRNGYLTSSDYGASFHYNFPQNYGDVHFGVYNGDGYSHAESNNQKAVQVRASIRPFAPTPVLSGFRATVFYDGDDYISNGERRRLVGSVTFENKYLNGGFEYLDAHDRKSGLMGTEAVEGTGYSFWVTPRTTIGWEGLLRYDHLTPNTSAAYAPASTAPNATTTYDSQKRNELIVGIAYWFPHAGSVSSALLFDYDAQMFDKITTQPARTFAIHGLINF